MNRLFPLLCIALLSIALSAPLVASAQGDTTAIAIKYGDIAHGELTSAEFEKSYAFEGKSGDIVIINLSADGFTGGNRRNKYSRPNWSLRRPLFKKAHTVTLSLSLSWPYC